MVERLTVNQRVVGSNPTLRGDWTRSKATGFR